MVAHGRVLARGVNRNRNDPAVITDRDNVHSIHAEVAALRQVRDPAGVVVYVARVRPDGSPALSAPCGPCAALLEAAGVRRVYWTTSEGAASA